LVEFDPYSEVLFADPFPTYKRLRDTARDLYLEQYDCFFLSRFEDVHNACRNKNFTHARGTTPMTLLQGLPPPPRALSSMVPPEHTALRASLNPDFMPGIARTMEAEAREVVRGYLDALIPQGTFDVNGDFAQRLAVYMTLRIIGLPVEDADWVAAQVKLAFNRAPGVRGPTEAADQANKNLQDYAWRGIAERRRSPTGSGVLGRLMGFEFEGRKLPDHELIANIFLMIIGGSETVPKAFAGAIYQLLKNPDQRTELAADPELAQDAFWETVRTDMPTLMLGASAEADTEICGGTKVRAGQKIMHLWASANRDEREFADPDRFDIHRRSPRIVSFNPGRHICLGIHIAQLEGRVMLQELLARLPDYEVDEDRAVRIRSEMFRGFQCLPITFKPH
jgi:cytochrome P450